MDRHRITLITAFVIAILFTSTAWAQATAAKVEVVSGNGQMACLGCAGKTFTFFYPMVVKVTDANGNPIANKAVNWQLISPPLGVWPTFDEITITDSNGLSVNRLSQGTQTGSAITPFLQSVISARADNASANFTETQALTTPSPNSVQIVFDQPITPFGTVLRGPAGSVGQVPIQIHIAGYTIPVPNVSLRLVSPDPKSLPSASCATGPGADPGSVLTDANGNATCYPVFGPVPGSGPIRVLVGGLDPAQFDQSLSPLPITDPVAFNEYPDLVTLDVTPVTPGLVSIVSGNNQNVNPGAASAPLTVKVTDATGNATIANANVTWTVSPAGAATMSPSVSSTNSAGQAQSTVIFSATAVGQITVRAALASNSSIATIFNLSTNVQIASLTKVSGDVQTTQSGQNFPAPLVVQVMGTNALPAVNQSVSFVVIGGSATLSANSAITDGNGRAQITVSAGSTPGPVTISAAIANVSQTFALTVIPPGPAINSGSFYSPGGGTRLGALSPCSLVTVIASGLAPNAQGLVLNVSPFGPWATTLASDTVTVNNLAAPIYSVGNLSGVEQLTFQVPCDVAPANSVPITINVGGGTGTVSLPVVAATPGIFETVMSDGVRRAVVIRPDGSFVSLQNPARRGEVARVFVTGLGPTAPAVSTGALPFAGIDALVLGQVIVGVNNAGTRVVTSRTSPNLIGTYEVAFQIPSDAPVGNDVVLSVAVNVPGDGQTRFSNGSKLPIAQ